ncbi:HNH endonuclease [Actinomycetales bacterium SN12]|nr:HNH endonuclease [Actinomycetales bacterium SN12]
MTSKLDALLQRREALLEKWAATREQITRLEAEAAALLGERWELFEEEIASEPGHRKAIERSMLAEYAAASRISKGSMEFAFSDARMLGQFPAVRDAFGKGRIGPSHVRHVLAESQPVRDAVDLGDVAPETLGLYEQAVLEVAERDTAMRTKAHARQVAAALAGVTVVERLKKAEEERSVTVRSVGDGLALLQAVLPEYLAVAIHDRLTAMARHLSGRSDDREGILPPSEPTEAEWAAWEAEFQAHERREHADTDTDTDTDTDAEGRADAESVDGGAPAGGACLDDDPYPFGLPPELDLSFWTDPRVDPDSPCITRLPVCPRTFDQLRADLLADLLLTSAPSDAHGTALAGIRARIQVTVAATTLHGDDDRPAELDGHGPLHPDIARSLAGGSTGWTRLFLTSTGMITETDTYTPTEPMRRFLRARDQHCRFPGCRMPVHRSELDHNLDWALGGPTSVGNLAHLCKTHHALKHPDVPDAARWKARQQPDQSLRWVSPTGRIHPDPVPRRVMFVPSSSEPPVGRWESPTAQQAGSPF